MTLAKKLQTAFLTTVFTIFGGSAAFAQNFVKSYVEVDVYPNAPRQNGASHENMVYGAPINIKPNLLETSLVCPAEEGGTQEVYIGPENHPDLILNVTETTQVDLFWMADLQMGRPSQLVFRQETSPDLECFFERILPTPQLSNPSFSRILQPGKYGVWFGLVDKPARPTGNENFGIMADLMGLSKSLNGFYIYVNKPAQQ